MSLGTMSIESFRALVKSHAASQEVTLARNDYLIEAGAIEKSIYYVVSGTLRVFMTDEPEEHTIRFAYPATLFMALDSFLSGKPTRYSIQAIKRCQLLAMPKAVFYEILNTEPKYRTLYLTLLEQFVLQQMEREEDLLTTSPAERYQRVLKRSPHLFQEVPNKYIASYLRMTPETLSRLKKS